MPNQRHSWVPMILYEIIICLIHIDNYKFLKCCLVPVLVLLLLSLVLSLPSFDLTSEICLSELFANIISCFRINRSDDSSKELMSSVNLILCVVIETFVAHELSVQVEA